MMRSNRIDTAFWPEAGKKGHSGILLTCIVCIWMTVVSFRLMASQSESETLTSIQKDDSAVKGNQCLPSIHACDLSCLNWTIVLSSGRSGGTTVQQMISKLPNMSFYGEEGGLLQSFYELQQKVENGKEHSEGVSWFGSGDINVTAVACMTQKFYAERHGSNCLHSGCQHGWKEIRYTSPQMIKWIRTVFPSSKLVLNYRSTCPRDYKDIFGRDCTGITKRKETILESTKNLLDVFHMELEQLNNLTKWHKLADFLGFGCKPLSVTSYNQNRTYSNSRHISNHNPWKCS
mmetsp:Transcript_10605/g.18624  ORF Transcript_10605/g.18624 Transcript_10605/m.18624 type:complete len:289 (-) Transcript_10605:122-988(-)